MAARELTSTAVTALVGTAAVGLPTALDWAEISGWTVVGVFVMMMAGGLLYPRPYVNRLVKQYEDRLAEVTQDRDTWRRVAVEQSPVKAMLANTVRDLVHDSVSTEGPTT